MGRRNSGFTLIELLVVIAIIAILAAILFPIFAGAKMNAQRVACVSNLKQLGSAFRMYMDDYGKYPGTGTYGGKSGEGGHPSWLGRVYIYAGKNDKVFRCPCAIQQQNVTVWVHGLGRSQSFQLSYSYNEYLNYQKEKDTDPDTLYKFSTESSVPNLKDTAMVADGYQNALFHDWDDSGAWNGLEGYPSGINRIRYADGPKVVNGAYHWEIRLVRHRGPNIVFADLHVQQVNKEKFKVAYEYCPGKKFPNQCRQYPIVYPAAQRY